LESDDRVNLVIKYLDEALGEVDAMDSLISSYKIHLNVSQLLRRFSCSDQFGRLWEMISLSSSRNDAVYKSRCKIKESFSVNSKTCSYVARLYLQRILTLCTPRKQSKSVRTHWLHLPKSLSRNKPEYYGSKRPPLNFIKHFKPVRIQVGSSFSQVT